MASKAQIQRTLDSFVEQYPAFKGLGIQAGMGTNPNAVGPVEFFSPDETGTPESPRPSAAPMGVPYVDIYDPSFVKESTFLGEGLHYLHRVDPRFNALREKFRESLTPEQLLWSRKRHKTYGDKRPYEKFFEVSDLDAMIRGYLAPDERDEWAGSYTADQEKLLNFMKSYLQGKGNAR